MLYVALRVRREGRWAKRDAVSTEFCGAVQRDAFIWVSRPAVRVMEVGGISFELSR